MSKPSATLSHHCLCHRRPAVSGRAHTWSLPSICSLPPVFLLPLRPHVPAAHHLGQPVWPLLPRLCTGKSRQASLVGPLVCRRVASGRVDNLPTPTIHTLLSCIPRNPRLHSSPTILLISIQNQCPWGEWDPDCRNHLPVCASKVSRADFSLGPTRSLEQPRRKWVSHRLSSASPSQATRSRASHSSCEPDQPPGDQAAP